MTDLTPRPPLQLERGRHDLTPRPPLQLERGRHGPFDRDPSLSLGMTGRRAARANETGRNA